MPGESRFRLPPWDRRATVRRSVLFGSKPAPGTRREYRLHRHGAMRTLLHSGDAFRELCDAKLDTVECPTTTQPGRWSITTRFQIAGRFRIRSCHEGLLSLRDIRREAMLDGW